jgi:hypothetical protein
LTSETVSLSAKMLTEGMLRGVIMSRMKWVGMALAAVTLGTGVGVLTFGASGFQDAVIPARQPSQPGSRAGSPTGPVRSVSELLSAQSRAGQRAYEQALASYRDGEVDSEKVYIWSQRLMQAQVGTAVGSYVDDPKSRAIHVTAARAHWDRMKQLEQVVQAYVEQGKDLPLSASTAEYYRIEAEGLVREYEYNRRADASHR